MNPNKLHSVITTIQKPTSAVRCLSRALQGVGAPLLIVGDRKGPLNYPARGTELLSFQQQLELPLELARKLPAGHYTRKNLGYLVAMSRGADCIYESDDDNSPLPGWKPRAEAIRAKSISSPGCHNVYQYFSRERIWPRGFPLGSLSLKASSKSKSSSVIKCPIQQGLVDGSPDVDAIWRLACDRPFAFRKGPSLALSQGAWCPFNSQSTWWWSEAYPLMYLPSACSFRMTDIWRSFVAQRCLWELGGCVGFHASEVFQKRNRHNLMTDFQQEMPGYLANEKIIELLGGLRLSKGPASAGENMLRCYEALISHDIFPSNELRLLQAWQKDLARVQAGLRL